MTMTPPQPPGTPAPPRPALQRVATMWGAAAAVANGAPAPTGYNPDAFYVRALDGNGHGDKIVGKIPPTVHAQIQEMVSSNDFPEYRMVMDVVRDGIVHVLEKRSQQRNTPALREQMQELIDLYAYDEISLKIERKIEMWRTTEERLRKGLTELAVDEAWDEMLDWLGVMEEQASTFPEPYRSRQLELIRTHRDRVPKECVVAHNAPHVPGQ